MDVSKKFMAEELKEKDHKDLKRVISHKAKSLSKKNKATKSKSTPKKDKIETTMHEFKEKTLHAGSKKGPIVKNKKQALAISLHQARKAGAKSPKKGK